MAASDPAAHLRDQDIGTELAARTQDVIRPPLVVTAKIKSALRIVALDEAAASLGLEPGQPLADARAMAPALDAVDEDAAADAALLAAIADWAERYTPLVALDAGGLMLDVTGCAHLFGGEDALVADLEARLADQGFAARAAIASTPGAAAAAARFTTRRSVAADATPALLAPLPLAALRLEVETVSALDRVGLKRIGQVMTAPRAPLAARFGNGLLRRLDQALGSLEEPIGPRRPVAALIAERRFAEPIARAEDIAASILSLAASLAASLEARGEGARGYELALFRVDGAVRRIAVGASRPIRAPDLVLDLFREKFAGLAEEIDAGFGFDMVRLSVPVSAADAPAQVDLAGDATGESDLGRLIDRIGARLGAERVSRIAAGDSHVPERAEMRGGGAGTATTPWRDSTGDGTIDRPLRLFARPEPVEAMAAVPDGPPLRFRWRRALYQIVRAEGPERIAPEWWRDGEELSRDYFRVEDPAGHRFWLYREGLYGRETSAPRWYLHGVFG
ncbi:MAG: DNA polymerase Y family protein [Bauldia sp.]|nr:DNA polymerase Y family protein [Bauldia sp.]